MKINLPIFNQKPEKQQEPRKLQLDNKILKQIVDEISIISAIKERELKDDQQVSKGKIGTAVDKIKSVVGRLQIAKPSKTIEPTKKEQKEESKTPLVGKLAIAGGAVGLLATISPFFKGFITGIIKETFDVVTGIMPEPVKDLVNLFTKNEQSPVKGTEQFQLDLQKADEQYGDKIVKEDFSQQKQIEAGQKNVERKTKKAQNIIDGVSEKPQQPEPTPEPIAAPKPEPIAAPKPEPKPEPKPTSAPTPAPTPDSTVVKPTPVPTQKAEPAPQAAPVTKPATAATETKKVPTTTEDIKKFQEENGIKPDGIVGPKTLSLLREKGLYPTESGVKGLIANTLQDANIVSPVAISNVLATVKAESNFVAQSENITQEKANKNYARTDGNNEPGDGFKFRGRGYIQHTGKNQYIALSKFLGIDLINDPDKLNTPALAAKALVWFFLQYKKHIIKSIQDLDDFAKINRAIAFHGIGQGAGGEEWQKRAKYAEQLKGEVVNLQPSTGATVAQTSADVVSAKKQEQAQKKIYRRDVLIAQSKTIAVPQ